MLNGIYNLLIVNMRERADIDRINIFNQFFIREISGFNIQNVYIVRADARYIYPVNKSALRTYFVKKRRITHDAKTQVSFFIPDIRA